MDRCQNTSKSERSSSPICLVHKCRVVSFGARETFQLNMASAVCPVPFRCSFTRSFFPSWLCRRNVSFIYLPNRFIPPSPCPPSFERNIGVVVPWNKNGTQHKTGTHFHASEHAPPPAVLHNHPPCAFCAFYDPLPLLASKGELQFAQASGISIPFLPALHYG